MPGRVGRRTVRRNTERVHRDAEWPARMLARAEAFQGEVEPAERGPFTADER
jgi:hypothetical protein